ncbi:MAG: hypothetical protein IJN13_00185 [Bacilli bacterium]|nr:hypothetical protein [Bacilli bacterium]
MKKFLSFMVMSLVAILPFTVDAATSISPVCGNADENGVRTCTIVGNITNAEGESSLTVTLTEAGGAEITEIANATDTDWALASDPVEVDGIWTVLLASPGVMGEYNLFTFKYKASGETDCKVSVSLGEETTEITPDPNPDTPETGSTLPYIALAVIALGAAGAYVATKNKAKMYRI